MFQDSEISSEMSSLAEEVSLIETAWWCRQLEKASMEGAVPRRRSRPGLMTSGCWATSVTSTSRHSVASEQE